MNIKSKGAIALAALLLLITIIKEVTSTNPLNMLLFIEIIFVLVLVFYQMTDLAKREIISVVLLCLIFLITIICVLA